MAEPRTDRERPATDAQQRPEVVRLVAERLLARLDELAHGMADHLHREIPELGGTDPELYADTLASCHSNIEQSYRLMQAGASAQEMVVTPAAREYARGMVARGHKVPVLLRTYRLGHAWIWEIWNNELRETAGDPQELTQAVEYSSRWIFEYIDSASAALVEDFAREQARRMRTAEQLRADTVAEILSGEPFDEEVASQRLGYDLRRRHVAAHVHSRSDRPSGVERAARELAQVAGAAPPLVIPAGSGSLDIWFSPRGEIDSEALGRLRTYEPPPGVSTAVGGCMAGPEGFCVSFAEARQAARVAALGPAPPATVGTTTVYADVELASLLAADLARARRFMGRVLGELAAADEQTGRLRQTVLAYLRCGRSTSRVAESLFVHQNTVNYRVRKAQELLGRPVTDDTAELMCALILAASVGPPPAS
jgi:DNA-binding PucR family transcriptional regulator